MATPATKKLTTKTRPVYYANVAFYIPRKGVVVNTFKMDEDYASMVNRIMFSVFYYTGEEGFQIKQLLFCKFPESGFGPL